jgi:membrane-bound ClpP family serine protease
MTGSRVTRLAVAAGLVVLVLDLVISRRLTYVFDVGFVLICVGAALAVHPRDFFHVGVLPPLLLLGLISLVAIAHSAWVAAAGDGFVQAVVSGLAHRATGLLAAYLLALGVLAIRQRVRARRRRAAYSKREVSPAPTRATTGSPSEKSTTVVGSEPHSPESITASNQ